MEAVDDLLPQLLSVTLLLLMQEMRSIPCQLVHYGCARGDLLLGSLLNHHVLNKLLTLAVYSFLFLDLEFILLEVT